MINYYAVVIEDEVKLIIPWRGDEYPTIKQISAYLSYLYPPPFSIDAEPLVEKVGSEVEVLAEVNNRPVMCKQGSVLVTSFHPELADDDRIHAEFLEMLSKS